MMLYDEFIRKSKMIIKRYLTERSNNNITDDDIEKYVYIKNITNLNSDMQGIYTTSLLDGNCFIIEYCSLYDRFKYIVYKIAHISHLDNNEKLTISK